MKHATRYAVTANVVQQACSAALVFLPNILGPAAYAEVVTANVLLSFSGLADLGLSQVYGRMVPGLVAQGKVDEQVRLESLVLRLGGGLVFGYGALLVLVVASTSASLSNAVMLGFVPLLLFVSSLASNRAGSMGNFRTYRNMLIVRALLSLLALPLAYFFNVTGWFLAQVIMGVIAVWMVRMELRSFLKPLGNKVVETSRYVIGEGWKLALVSVLWTQILYGARTISVLLLGTALVASYGVVVTIYQALAALLISAFLPVTVELNRLASQGTKEVLQHAELSLNRYAFWIPAAAFLGVILELCVLPHLFPKFEFSPAQVILVSGCLMFYPIFLTLGGILVALRKYRVYLTSIMAALLVCGITALTSVSELTPAISQLVGVFVLCIGLVIAVIQVVKRDGISAHGLAMAVARGGVSGIFWMGLLAMVGVAWE